jgi:hypothetical protein
MWDLFADERCSQANLDFLSTTDVGRLRKTHKVRCRSGNSGSGEKGKRSGRWKPRSWVLGVGNSRCFSRGSPSGFVASAEEE